MVRRLVVVLSFLVLVSRSQAGAQALPPLPLPDCVANGLTFDAFTDCEGTLAGVYGANDEVPRPEAGEITLAISTRAVDFRLDADGPAGGQFVTFTFDLPEDKQGSGANGVTYESTVRLLQCKKETDCGGTKGQTSFCVVQPKFTPRPGRQVANDLDAGALDAAKEDVLCLPARLAPS